VLAKLTLTDEQKPKIQAIKEKFAAEMKKWDADRKAELDAARSALSARSQSVWGKAACAGDGRE